MVLKFRFEESRGLQMRSLYQVRIVKYHDFIHYCSGGTNFDRLYT